jgi:sugar-specific transcriptional regulator TrmB
MTPFEDVLNQAGLDELESKTYNTLLSNGALTILELSKKSSLKRTNLYNVLVALEKKGLVTKISEYKKTKYLPNSPRQIQELLKVHENQIDLAKNTFEVLIDNLQSQYNLISHKPVISYLEGTNGLQKLYDDILDVGKDICLVRSTYDDKRADVDKLVQKQITAQVKRNIHARVVGPPEQDAKALYKEYDKIRLVEERFVPNFFFNLPAQVVIYGHKVAITTIRKEIIITLIDNKEINESFKILFEFVWQYAKPEHDELVKNWK